MRVTKLARCACVWLLIGCGGASGPADQAGPHALGLAAALVNGEPIELAEVRRLSIATGLTPQAALSRLVTERLLEQYARARGYAAEPAVRRGVAQAQVRALLAQAVEAPASGREQNDGEAPASARERHDSEGPERVRAQSDREVRGSLAEPMIEERRRELARLLEQLALRTPVRYDEAAIRTAFAQ